MDAALTRDPGPGTRDILFALLVSLLVHLMAFAALVMLRSGASPMPEVPPLLDVDVVSLPPPAPAAKAPPAPPMAETAPAKEEPAPPAVTLPEKQIVSPPDEGKEEAPKSARFLSDRDNTVKEQMVRKGEPEPGSAREPVPPAPPPAAPRERPAQAKARSAPPPAASETGSRQMARTSLEQLLPSASQIAREGYADNSHAATEKPSQTERRDVMRYADSFAPSGGRRGTMDFLPDVREGDVTLLNTKAELFAPFVRRVAQRVFQSQIITLRRDVPRLGVTTTEAAAVEAVMNRQGVLVSVRVTEQSGTSTVSIDRHLQRACQQAFFDLNPPPGAESNDGNIHFVFRTQVQVVATPQGLRNYGAVLMAGLM